MSMSHREEPLVFCIAAYVELTVVRIVRRVVASATPGETIILGGSGDGANWHVYLEKPGSF